MGLYNFLGTHTGCFWRWHKTGMGPDCGIWLGWVRRRSEDLVGLDMGYIPSLIPGRNRE